MVAFPIMILTGWFVTNQGLIFLHTIYTYQEEKDKMSLLSIKFIQYVFYIVFIVFNFIKLEIPEQAIIWQDIYKHLADILILLGISMMLMFILIFASKTMLRNNCYKMFPNKIILFIYVFSSNISALIFLETIKFFL